MSISIIVPCYNEEESLPYFYQEFCKLTQDIMPAQSFELLLVDDGSTDGTLPFIQHIAANDTRVKYLSLSRNFGKESALYAGLAHATGQYMVTMDADLQHPLTLLPPMYHAVTNEGYDSAATRRVSRRGEPLIRSCFARLFYTVMKKFMQPELVDGACDFRLMNRKFSNAVLSLHEYNRFTKGLYAWVGFKTKWIEFENQKRVAGETKWTVWKLLSYAMEGLIAFTTKPLVLSAVTGALLCLAAFIATLFVIVRKLLFGDPVQGWASTMCVILSIGGIQLLCTGILGQYLAKAYMESKRRPLYIVANTNMLPPVAEVTNRANLSYQAEKLHHMA